MTASQDNAQNGNDRFSGGTPYVPISTTPSYSPSWLSWGRSAYEWGSNAFGVVENTSNAFGLRLHSWVRTVGKYTPGIDKLLTFYDYHQTPNSNKPAFLVKTTISLAVTAAGVTVTTTAVAGAPVTIGALALGAAAFYSYNYVSSALIDYAYDSGAFGFVNTAVSWGLSYFDPLILDLDGDGIELIKASDSTALFNMTGEDDDKNLTGWVSSDDGILVLDKDGNGQIDGLHEVFSEQFGQAGSGIDALATLDTNSDGVFNAEDEAFDQVRVWRDFNGNGVVDAGELFTLASLGISEINLSANKTDILDESGNLILQKGTFTRNGAVHNYADVGLIASTSNMTKLQTVNGIERYQSADDELIYGFVRDIHGKSADAGAAGVNILVGNKGNDILTQSGDYSIILSGAAGNDQLTGGAHDDILSGGDGADQLYGGEGDDLLNIDADDTVISGGGGNDTAIVSGDEGVTINLSTSSIEVFIGGGGDDVSDGSQSQVGLVISGGRGDDVLKGGEADDLLNGGVGSDTLYGGSGSDIAAYKGNRADYIITKLSSTKVTVYHIETQVTDTLYDIERLTFEDGTIHLDGKNNMPLASGETYKQRGTEPITFSAHELLSNDIEFDGEALTIIGVGHAINGEVDLAPDGTITFTPLDGFVGEAGFSYRISDEQGATQLAQVSITLLQDKPTDTYFASQWHLEALYLDDVWDDYTGQGVTISINDDAVETDHPDYHVNYDTSIDWDYYNNDSDPSPWSDNGLAHGTFIAGLIGAARNGIGVVGVAYGATLVGIARNGFSVERSWEYDISNNSWTPNAFATNSNGDKVRPSNATIFSDNGSQGSLVNGFQRGVEQGRDGLGTIYVVSGGNTRHEFHNTNHFDVKNEREAIAVAALDANGVHTYFSTPGASLLVSAGGASIFATDRQGEAGYNEAVPIQTSANTDGFGINTGASLTSDYASGDGTSFSAPIVSGVVALMLEANPNLGWRDVQEILVYSSWNSDQGNPGWADNGTHNWNGGGLEVSHDYGFGQVDARAAVRLAESWTSQHTSSNEVHRVYSKHVGSHITDNASNGLTSTITVSQNIILDHVEVYINLDHQRLADLVISLTSPDGTKSVLLNRPEKNPHDTTNTGYVSSPGSGIDWEFYTSHHWGEQSSGQWSLTVQDLETGYSGRLNNWKLHLYGDNSSHNDTYIYTVDYGNYTQDNHSTRRILDDQQGNDTINTATVPSDVFIDLSGRQISQIMNNELRIADNTTIENIVAGDGNDTLIGNVANNNLKGGRGDDTLIGGQGADTLDGGRGVDLASYESSQSYIHVNLVQGTGTHGDAAGDTLRDIENVTGSRFNDSLTGNDKDNILKGGMGDDKIYGMAGKDNLSGDEGNDRLEGGAGEDTLFGGVGNDTIIGGSGYDTAIFRGYHEDYTITSSNGVTTVEGQDGTDTLSSVEYLQFSDKIISLAANSAPNALSFNRSVNEDQVLFISAHEVLAKVSDPDGDQLKITEVGNASHGSVSLDSSGNIIFKPVENYSGMASFDYTVSDGRGGTGSATIEIEVFAVNDAPEGQFGKVITYRNGTVSGQLTASDSDHNDTDLTYSLIAAPTKGTFSLNGDGSYIFSASIGSFGTDSFIYRVTDPSGYYHETKVDIQIFDYPKINNLFLVANQSFDFKLDQVSLATQLAPKVAELPNAGFATVWTSNDTEGLGVYLKLFDGGGNAVTEQILVNSFADKNQYYADVTNLANGGLVVTWTSTDQDGSYTGIYGQKFDEYGNIVGEEFLVNEQVTSYQFASHSTGLVDGSFVVVWNSINQDGDATAVIGRKFDEDGEPLTGDVVINTHIVSNQDTAKVAYLTGGGFVVVWESSGQDGSGTGIFGQRFDSDFNKIGTEFQVNSYIEGEQTTPSVTGLAEGGFVVTWQSENQDGSSYGIIAKQFDSDGIAREELIVTSAPFNLYDQRYATVIANEDGGFSVLYTSYRYTALLEKTYSSEGIELQGAPRLASDFNEIQHVISDAVLMEDGNVAFVYRSPDFLGLPVVAKIAGNTAGTIFNPLMLVGSDSDDNLFGADAGDHFIAGDGDDQQYGNGGNDTFVAGLGNDKMVGGSGWDIVDYGQSDHAIVINLETNEHEGEFAIGDVFQGVEHFVGSSFGDQFIGNSESNSFEGGQGADRFDGAGGEDWVRYENSAEGVRLNLLTDLARRGDAEGDVLIDIENVEGSGFDDWITGDNNNNRIDGGLGDDTLEGLDGSDWLLGGDGNDSLMGGNGLDYLFGGEGTDELYGGGARDYFIMNELSDTASSADKILDFVDGEDLIYLNNKSSAMWFQKVGADIYLKNGADSDSHYYAVITNFAGIFDGGDIANSAVTLHEVV